VSPTPTLKPALFLILILPVVAPLASVGKKLAADLDSPASFINPSALLAIPFHLKLELTGLNPCFSNCLFGKKVSSAHSVA
jgi:hypothetical protein